ncbi:hypothetical protein T11_6580 [Trichinella zimbabwensis]|uniref:Uncharacterized protein n=1 Tax=Trichinella zimbabwensis TaxID=268475 RepID=A0A0V1H2Y6_9BILA|nr:hypothetical protein T11_6580 [Trichinella zimbabwensis]
MLDSCLLEQRRANFAAWPLKSSTSQLLLLLALCVFLLLNNGEITENMSAVRLILHRLVISISVSLVFARSEEPRNEVDGQTNRAARVHILSAPFAKIDKSNQAVMWTSCNDSKFTSAVAVAAQHLVCNNLADEISGGLKQLLLVLAHLCHCSAFFSTHFTNNCLNILLSFDSGQKKHFSKINAEEEQFTIKDCVQ